MIEAFLFSFFLFFQGDTTGSPWPYQHVDKRAKLSNSAITSVFMDRHEYIWLGTWDGLNRYDGSSIKVYKPDPFIKGTISNNVIRNFLEDGHGNLWVVTHLGIDKYDPTTESFQAYLDSLYDIPFLENNIRACIGPDSAVWASLIGKGILRYSFEKNQFLPVNFEGIDSQWLTSTVDIGHHLGLLYLLGEDGKVSCAVNNRLVYSKQLVSRNQLKQHKFIRFGKDYFLAIIDDNSRLLLFRLAEIEKEIQVISLGNVSVSSLSENSRHDALWIGTESGDILKVTPFGNGFTARSMNSYFPKFSKARLKILTITETNQDIVWIGTDGDGVYKFLTRPKAFYSITAGSPESGQLSHSIVRSVYEDVDGVVYVGTRGGGLNIVEHEKTRIINSKNGLSNNAVLSLNKDHVGNLWIGHDGEGIDMLESKSHTLFHFPKDFDNAPKDLPFGSVYSICVDAFNDLWLGTSGYGMIHLKILRLASGRYHLVDYDQVSNGKTSRPSIQSNIIYSIVEEKPNILWFGTRGSGIYRYNTLGKKIEEHIQADALQKNTLCNNDVLSLLIDKEEELWVGTSGGMNRLYLQNKPYRIEHYTQQNDGLNNNTIHSIVEDASANIWASTNHGLVRFDRERQTFKIFDTNDGLQNMEFTDGAAYKSAAGEKLFFGGIDGLDIVYPAKLNPVNYFPRITLTEFQVHNRPVQPGDKSHILDRNIDFTHQITLPYDQNFISLSFTTLDYWNKQKDEYSYFLENFDKSWNNIGQQQTIVLTNIPPGTYTLYIHYKNENGMESTPRTLGIIVTPPFWKTAWAYLLYGMLAIALQIAIVLYIRWRSRAKKSLAIDKFTASQLKKLNDYKLQFFTNIAHEFRTPLTLILGPVTTLLNNAHDNTERKQLQTIYGNSLRLQKLIDELMHFRKIESGKDHLEISKIDLVSFTHQIVESFQQHASEHEEHLEFHPEPEALIAWVDPNKIEKILLNLISNAIKYNSKGGRVIVSLRDLQGKVFFAVRDEGIGIAKENHEKIFESFYQNPNEAYDQNGIAISTGIGLSLTKSLVQIHRGIINVESTPGKGSTFSVVLPISREAYTDLREDKAMVTPSDNLSEKISLEFEKDHYLLDQPEKVMDSVLNKHPYSLLVVDDNAQITSLLNTILSDKYIVFKAADGKKALEILDEERIDLVISDVLMPDMDGLTLCRKIKENIQTSHIPVILLTARAEIENRIEGLQVGADSYIPKPFHPEHLFVRVEKLIGNMEMVRRKFATFADVELNHLSTGIGQRDDDFFSKITDCIQKHLSETEFNAETIADEVGMSKASLYKKIKTITGLTPHGLIKQYRLKKASELLRNSKMSVSEVIYETGFNSRSYFYKSFNEMFHCHPKDFS